MQPRLHFGSDVRESQDGERPAEARTPPIQPADDRRRAFTLLELLLVILIMGMLAALTLPNLKGIRQANVEAEAGQQLLDDLATARRLAISKRTKVYMLFVPPVATNFPTTWAPRQLERHLLGQYTSYTLFTWRQVGEQPGRNSPRYFGSVKSLPQGLFIQAEKFDPKSPGRFQFGAFPYPTTTNAPFILPFLVFDHQGRLVLDEDPTRPLPAEGEVIPMAHGGVLPERDGNGVLQWGPATAMERPPGNSYHITNAIVIDWLTGRPRWQRAELSNNL